MTKKEIVNRIAEKGYTKRDADQVFEDVVATIRECLLDNEKVHLPSLGSFEVRQRKARKFRNVTTGEIEVIPGQDYVKFSMTQEFRRLVKEGTEVQE